MLVEYHALIHLFNNDTLKGNRTANAFAGLALLLWHADQNPTAKLVLARPNRARPQYPHYEDQLFRR